MNTDAVISKCGTYRYALWRIWDARLPSVLFIGLNPSTADQTKDDPTVLKCMEFARRWKYGGIYLGNLFAYRATDPTTMKAAHDPVGPENDAWLKKLAAQCQLVVAAWGEDGSFLQRSASVRAMLNGLHYLKLNKSGEPSHPLYLPSTTLPAPLPPLRLVTELTTKPETMSHPTSFQFQRLKSDAERKAFYAELHGPTWWLGGNKRSATFGWVEVFEKSDGKCVYCSRDLATSTDALAESTEEHLVPRSLLEASGMRFDNEHNMAVCCAGCNGLKNESVPPATHPCWKSRKAFVKECSRFVAECRLKNFQKYKTHVENVLKKRAGL